ncbi:hypothetical protein PLESTB_001686600 [Pleodorina starrii]|uniref:Uncharacterized protein n=1 Tax=Pleodorina starrii TaxID=330485 RepID=A0A9W6BTN0_9CHLO|nr:hypothetical protein PLESTM_001081100 [Pleodorina starrii]GLC57547.1 hypothetical protein PLESTB_001239000 [Pleodorina starrii]GLC60867.1 hypothetical protein PLESTB_001685100 [Pleodorina starrii]GLC60879.1 hypothetical protein PLESTB_001686600 [Pleodorina starrii]GLC66670.1 hypothetical protein PLESTF_000459300 [Pleodorina starrii]
MVSEASYGAALLLTGPPGCAAGSRRGRRRGGSGDTRAVSAMISGQQYMTDMADRASSRGNAALAK